MFNGTINRHRAKLSIVIILELLLRRMNDELLPILASFESAAQNRATRRTERHQYATSFLTQVVLSIMITLADFNRF